MTDLLARAGLPADRVDEIIVANALGGGGNPARMVALAAGLPERIAGLSIDRQCAGGLDAVLLADMMVRSGQAQVVIAGGVESYSRRPLRAWQLADGSTQPYDRPAFAPWPERDPDLAEAADALAHQLNISREDQDIWACASHAKALAARDILVREITGDTFDGYSRRLRGAVCARAKPIFGSVTFANTSVAADGAAFVLVTSPEFAASIRAPMAEIVSGATLGGAPELPGVAPVAAMQKALNAAGITPADLRVAEVMEAYAAQAIACVRGAGIDPTIVNPCGGSLARGHPIGASGAILAVRLFHQLGITPGNGIAAIAAAGGLGSAMVLRRPA